MNIKDKARADWRARFENRSLKDVSAKPSIEVRNLSTSVAEMLIYDEIGYYGISATDVAQQLAGITAPTLRVRVNSPGGDVFDGLAIYNQLKAHPATIETYVDGLAASAASFIALAGDTVEMAPQSMMMIHKAWGMMVGNADDATEFAATLNKIDGQLAAIYAQKTGKSVDEVMAAMSAETWFTADEALAFGLCDEVESPEEEKSEPEPDAEPDPETDKPKNLVTPRIAAMRRRLNLARVEI